MQIISLNFELLIFILFVPRNFSSPFSFNTLPEVDRQIFFFRSLFLLLLFLVARLVTLYLILTSAQFTYDFCPSFARREMELRRRKKEEANAATESKIQEIKRKTKEAEEWEATKQRVKDVVLPFCVGLFMFAAGTYFYYGKS